MAPTPGNHEWPEAREGYEPFWRDVTGETPPTYYAFNAGGWEVLSLNSEHSEWRPAENWLRTRRARGGNCRIAFWHRPPYSAGKYEDGDGSRARVLGGARGRRADRRQRARPQHAAPATHATGSWSSSRAPADGIGYDVDEGDPDLAFGDDDALRRAAARLRDEPRSWRFVDRRAERVLDSGSLGCRA